MLTRPTILPLSLVGAVLAVGQLASASLDSNGNLQPSHEQVLVGKGGKIRQTACEGTAMLSVNEYLKKNSYNEIEDAIGLLKKREKFLQVNPFKSDELQEIRLVLSVSSISDDSKCSQEEFDQLSSLDELLDNRASRLERIDFYCRRNIEHIVHRLFAKYVKKCEDQMRCLAQVALDGVDKFALKTLTRNIASGVLGQFELLRRTDLVELSEMKSFGSSHGFFKSINCFASLEELPAGTEGIRVDVARNLLQKYVFDGCKSFLESTEKSATISLLATYVDPEFVPGEYGDVQELVAITAVCKSALNDPDALAVALSSNWRQHQKTLADYPEWKELFIRKLRE